MLKHRNIVVVAASEGGISALKTLVCTLPAEFPASVFLVMHIGAHPSILPQLLEQASAIRVKHADDGEEILPSLVYVAPPDRHMLLDGNTIRLSAGPKENFTRPAADPLFRSAAVHHNVRTVGVVLTGNLDDGAAGLAAIAACGGFTIVQDPSDCIAPDMPAHALDAVMADAVLPVAEIGRAIVDAVTQPLMPRNISMKAQEDATVEARIQLTGRSSMEDLDRLGKRSALTCPDCGGAIWSLDEGKPLRFRCHTGHAFSAKSLAYEQRKHTEEALWAAVRHLTERLSLAKEELDAAAAANDAGDLEPLRATLEELGATLEATRRIAISKPDGGGPPEAT